MTENAKENEQPSWYATEFDSYVAEAVPRLNTLTAEVGRHDSELTDQRILFTATMDGRTSM